MTMELPSEDVKDMLVADSSLGLTFNTNLFIGREPDGDGEAITIYDAPGRIPQTTLDGEVYYYPSVQIRVRESGYVAAYNKIKAIISSLHTKHHGETFNGSIYIMILSSGEPFPMGWTEAGQALFIANFNLQRKEA